MSATASLGSGPAPTTSAYDLTAHQTLSRVILLIRENYVDPDRIAPYDMFLGALDQIEKTVPEVIIDTSHAPQAVTVRAGDDVRRFQLGGLDQLWEVTMALRDIFRFLQSEIKDPERRQDIEYAAINGMLATLDPHSVLLKPESFDEVKMSTKGEFGGLGIVISLRESLLTVISPIAGTPAAKAGLKTQDQIVKIGEESSVNMTLEDAVHRLRGEPGTNIDVWVLRRGWSEAKRFTLTRAIIKINSVTSKLLASSIGYLRIKSFQNRTYEDMHEQLAQMVTQNKGAPLKGLILDLRNNPGGLLDQAIEVSDEFIDQGPLVITVGEGNRKRDVKSAKRRGTEMNTPIVVLVNGGSASASEIVSGALRNHDRAIVIGSRTFGKGSVQVLYDFKDSSALKLTIAQYLTPGDVSIQSVGIEPDVEIVPALISKERIQLFAEDTGLREQDLDKHLNRHGDVATQKTQESPTYRIIHVEEPEKPDEVEAAAMMDEFTMDKDIELAQSVLLKTTSTNRKEMLKQAVDVFAAQQTLEHRDIESHMKALAIDWSNNQGDAKPWDGKNVVVTLTLPKRPVMAGEMLKIIAEVENKGKQTVSRLYGITESSNPLLKNLEFVFGKVAPGEKRQWATEIKIPAHVSARADNIVIRLGSGSSKPIYDSEQAFVQIDEKERPRLAYRYRLDDTQGGNADGQLQAGETITLYVDVKNMGEGVAEEAMAALHNKTGPTVLLDKGRAKLGTLKPNGEAAGTLTFHLNAPLTEKEIKLNLSIWATSDGAFINHVLLLPVSAAKPIRKTEGVFQATDSVSVWSSPLDGASRIGFLRPSMRVHADGEIGRYKRVVIGHGQHGFVIATQLKAAQGKAQEEGIFSPVEYNAVPDLQATVSSWVTADSTIKLSGKMTDDHSLQDVYVYVNNKKIYYEPLGQISSIGRGVQVPLELTVQLKPGGNDITVVLREEEQVLARRSFSVFKR